MGNEPIENAVLVIPCSGIGKVHGLISREATYLVTDELATGRTDTLCLALLVKGDSGSGRGSADACLCCHRRVREGLRREERRPRRRNRHQSDSGGRSVQEPPWRQAGQRNHADRRRLGHHTGDRRFSRVRSGSPARQ